MIVAFEKVGDEAPNLQFKRLYLCSKTNPMYLLENEFIDDFLSYDDGVPADINDPFLLSFIYAN
jgi:hypothetical protein